MKVNLKWITPEAEKEIVEIARVSSNRKDKTENIGNLLKYLLNNKHFSPFEMANMCIEIETSRAIGRQILRHRSFSFQEFSQRYSEVTEFEEVKIRKQAETNRQSSTEEFDPDCLSIDLIGETNEPFRPASQLIKEHIVKSEGLYKALLKAGVAREQARMILPECTQTRLYCNGTIRSWIHFLEIRDDEHAQLESQEIAREIKKIFKEHLPILSKILWD